MGSRAHYVIVEAGAHELYYDRWGAECIDMTLVHGPEQALAWMRDGERRQPHDWMDEVWIEGGALVDLDRSVLLFFGHAGAHGSFGDLGYRRVVFRILALMWPGWTIRWACGGVSELARYVGAEPPVAPDLALAEPREPTFQPPAADGFVGTLVTVRHPGGGITAHPLAWFIGSISPAGLDRLPPGLDRCDCPSVPHAGIHVDLGGRTVAGWSATGCRRHLEASVELPQGWGLEFWGDRYAIQAERCGGAVSFPPLDFAEPLDWLERGLRWVYVFPRCPREVPAGVAPALAAVRAELLASG